MPDSFDLTYDECCQLLRVGVVGRVALCTADGPHIIPLNYAVVDDFVVFRTSPYSVLGTSGRNSVLAFEIDQVDPERQRGWSVEARGRCQWIADTATITKVAASWQSRPWASGSRHLYLRLPMTEITGRKLGHDWDPLIDLPMHRAVEEPV